MQILPVAAAAVFALQAAAAVAHDAAHHRIEGPADRYVYQLAEPGTYALPPIRPAADARLLEETGDPVRLSDLYRDRITLLAFMYTRCGDICPIAAWRMSDLQFIAAEEPAVASRLRLASLSFDPDHDTPARMAEYAYNLRAPGSGNPESGLPDWRFLTAPGAAEIAPVIAAYDQPVAVKADPDDPAGPLGHLLRVFLVDDQGMIRNIYSADFLDPRLVLNDVRTLLMDAAAHDHHARRGN